MSGNALLCPILYVLQHPNILSSHQCLWEVIWAPVFVSAVPSQARLNFWTQRTTPPHVRERFQFFHYAGSNPHLNLYIYIQFVALCVVKRHWVHLHYTENMISSAGIDILNLSLFSISLTHIACVAPINFSSELNVSKFARFGLARLITDNSLSVDGW